MKESSENLGPVGFWRALRGVCTGTEIFYQLRRNSRLRTLWHLFLMALLCSIGILLGQWSRILPEIRHFEQFVTAEFGSNLHFSSAGIVPEKAPDTPREFALPLEGKFLYLPGGNLNNKLCLEQIELLNYLVLWSPGFFITAQHYENDSWLVSLLAPSQDGGTLSMFVPSHYNLTNAKFKELLLAQIANNFEWPIERTGTQSFTVLFDSVKTGMVIVLLVMQLIGILAFALFYTVLFAVMYQVFNFRNQRELTFGEFWKFGVYAGFPVMLVASCFPAFDLPYFKYSTIYMIGLAVYWMIAAARVEQSNVSDVEE